MSMRRTARILGLALLAGLVPSLARPQPKVSSVPLSPRVNQPRAEAVAETKLLMEGLAQPNFRGLDTLLRQKPENDESWAFARGQALLIAETANLLHLRPPNNGGAEAWHKGAAEMRESAKRLASAVAARDLNLSRARLTEVANACNRCHQTFRVTARLTPFEEKKE
jgi:hypothetical protein